MTLSASKLSLLTSVILAAPGQSMDACNSVEDCLGQVELATERIAASPGRYPIFTKVLEELDPLLTTLNRKLQNHPNKDRVKQQVFLIANKHYLSHKGNRELNALLAELLITSIHRKVTGLPLYTLQDNFRVAREILEYMPYNHGFVNELGHIQMRKEIEVLRDQRENPTGLPYDSAAGQGHSFMGLNCIRMNNIISSLVVGANEYNPEVYETNEDIYTKPEFTDMGVYSRPVIEDFPAYRADELGDLLGMYGHYFTVQEYSSVQGRPVHTYFIEERNGQYLVWDTLAGENVFAAVSEVDEFFSPRVTATLTINLLDTEQVFPVAQAKSPDFLVNLHSASDQAREEYLEYQLIVSPGPGSTP